MPPRVFPRSVQRLLVVFFAVTLLLTATLVWLSWQLVRQDEALVDQRVEERREAAADAATAALQTALVQADQQLRHLLAARADEPASGAAELAARLDGADLLLLTFPSDVRAFPGGTLLFYPVRPASARIRREIFARVDSLEFVRQDFPAAARAARALAREPEPAIRAGATMRLARIQRKSGQLRDALAAYEALATLDPVEVEELPAGLVARHEILALLDALGERERLEREAAAFSRDLQAGRWRLLRAEYDFYLGDVGRYAPSGDGLRTGPLAGLVRALAAERLWDQFQAIRAHGGASAGRRVEQLADVPVLLLWQATPGMLAGLVVQPDTVRSAWLAHAGQSLVTQGVGIALTDTNGRAVLGAAPTAGTRHSLRSASATALPWNVYALTLDAGARHAYFDTRRRVLFAGLLATAALVLTGTYLLWRLVAREVAVSRLQADFVSAVSHEFRTPLTGLRQFSEMLLTDRVSSEHDRREYYRAMARETGRLSTLVERLLEFGRLEAGALDRRLEPLDLGALARDVAADFIRDGNSRNHRVECAPFAVPLGVRGDRATLTCVVWNLLDNAVKYSPENTTIHVEPCVEGGAAVIRVRDQGAGIPASEREQIFRKFYRGEAAKAAGASGAGIGLAMAREIAAAHDGTIEVESVVGDGSVFTLRVPLAR